MAQPEADPCLRHAICEITVASLGWRERLDVIAASGASGIGVFIPRLPQSIGPEEVQRAIDEAGMRVAFVVPEPFTLLPIRQFSPGSGLRRTSGGTLRAATDGILRSLQWAAALEPAAVLVLTGGQGGLSAQEAWTSVAECLGELADAAAALGIDLALEVCSPRYTGDWDLLETIDDACELVDHVGRSNLGVMLDVFHIWEMANIEQQIERAAGRIKAVHLSDSGRFPRSLADRLPPGQGVVDVARIVAAIERTGYRGWYESEVVSDDGSISGMAFPDSWWARPAAEVVQACQAGYESLVPVLTDIHTARFQ